MDATRSGSMDLPYFDLLLDARRQDPVTAATYDRYVHWGYWRDPGSACTDPGGFAAAMASMDAEIRAAADLRDDQTVLDVGCGFGGTLKALHAEFSNMRLVGITLDGRQLTIARAQEPNARFIRANACELPFANASFDRILAVESVFHFPDRLGFLRESARVLKDEGRLALSDFVPRRLWLSKAPFARLLERHVRTGYGPVGNQWPDGDYAAIARAARMTVVVDRNVTSHTLPTYRAMLKLLGRHLNRPAVRRMVSPTLLLYWISRLGLLDYRIVAMQKRPARLTEGVAP